jgi:3-methyladenine DNA glycosylase AlkD
VHRADRPLFADRSASYRFPVTASPRKAARRLADGIEAALRAVGSPERAEHEKRYLKSDLVFVGASVPQTNTVVRVALTEAGELDHPTLVAAVDALWGTGIFECRMAAVEILSRSTSVLGPADLPLLERLVRESRTWALVDGLAASVVGRLVERYEAAVSPVLDRWAGDDDFWARRSSLLAELLALRAGDEAAFHRFVARAEPMLEETEFFVRKAIGGVLREAGRRLPAAVVAWLEPRAGRASGVTMREAVKYLPEADAARLMAIYKGRGAGGKGRAAGGE